MSDLAKLNPVSGLVRRWHDMANEYDKRDREATKRREYVIAAQQAGLACAFRVCAQELETRLKIEAEANLSAVQQGGEAKGE